MAHKLTEQEQAAVVSLAKLLGKELPATHRSYAGGVASGLVRLRKNPLSRDDALAVLGKYGAGDDALEALVSLGVLRQAEGGYLLTVPEAAERDGARGGGSAQAGRPQGKPAKPSPAERDRRPEDRRSEARPEGAPAAKAPDAPAPRAEGDADAPRAIARAERPKPPARREPARSLSHLDTVRKQTPELNDIRRQIIGLDPRLWINGWLLSTPDAFVRYEPELRALDAAIAGSATLGDGSLSCRELSYRVFGDEKFLALDSDGRKLLHLMGLSGIVTHRQQAKLGMLHHIPRRHDRMRIVVSENLDPWTNMRDRMYVDGKKRVFGERVHGVVFGNGYLVNDPHKLPDLLSSLGANEVEVLYWGDIDRAGLSILSKLVRTLEGRFEVAPFAAAYHQMLKRAMRRFPDPLDNEPCDQEGVQVEGLKLLEPLLKDEEAEYLRAVVEGSRLIPQEIITRADL